MHNNGLRVSPGFLQAPATERLRVPGDTILQKNTKPRLATVHTVAHHLHTYRRLRAVLGLLAGHRVQYLRHNTGDLPGLHTLHESRKIYLIFLLILIINKILVF